MLALLTAMDDLITTSTPMRAALEVRLWRASTITAAGNMRGAEL